MECGGLPPPFEVIYRCGAGALIEVRWLCRLQTVDDSHVLMPRCGST